MSKPRGLVKMLGSFPIRQNIYQFDFTGKDTLADKMVVHIDVLGPGVDDGVLL